MVLLPLFAWVYAGEQPRIAGNDTVVCQPMRQQSWKDPAADFPPVSDGKRRQLFLG